MQMYNECNSLTSGYKITLKMVTYRKARKKERKIIIIIYLKPYDYTNKWQLLNIIITWNYIY